MFATGSDEQSIERRLAFGFGYAQAEERLFQMEILRRAAEGRLSDLVGPSYLRYDEEYRRDAETDAERADDVARHLSPADLAALGSIRARFATG